jgi:hypothetical protein
MKKLIVILVFFVGCQYPSRGVAQTWTHIQGSSAANASSVTSLTVTLPNNPGAGHDVVLGVEFDAGPVSVSGVSVQDENGNSYVASAHSPFVVTSNHASLYLFYLLNAPSNASKTININWTTGVDTVAWADEFSASTGTSAFDTDTGATNTFSGTAINLPTITPTSSNELLYALALPAAVTAPAAGASAGPWIGAAGGIDTTATDGMAEYDLGASATTAPNFTNSVSGGSAIVALLAIASPSGGGGGGTVTGSGTTNRIPVFTGTSTIANSPMWVNGANVGIGISSPAMPLHLLGGNDPATGMTNCGAESATCPGSSSSSYGMGLDADYTSGQWRWRLESVDRGNGVPLYVQQSQATANSFNNVARFGYDQYDSNVFAVFGNMGVGGSLHVSTALYLPDGTAQTTAWTGVLCGGDYAEAVNASGPKEFYQPGDVLVLASGAKDEVQKSAEPYSTMVAGIFATKPGVIGRRQTLVAHGAEIPMAMVGIVPTKVTTENGPIHRGDLLVTSSITGYAMKGTDRSRMLGAVIGKAMGSLDSGEGVIEVLVTLQ